MPEYVIKYENMNPRAETEWTLHRKGCRDLGRSMGGEMPISASTPYVARYAWIDDEMVDLGYDLADIRIMGCSL